MRHLRFILVAAAISFVAPALASADERPMPNDFLKTTNVEIQELAFKKVTGAEATARDEALRTKVGGLIDYDDMAMRSLGKHWEPLTPEQRTEYQTLFRKLVELSYIDKLSDQEENPSYEIEWDKESVKDDLGFGKVFIIDADIETEVDFILKAKDASWLIHDIKLDGASLEETYQRNYGKQIEEEGFDSLLDKMRERIAELEK